MTQFDIRFWKLIVIGGGVIIAVAELCLLGHEWISGCPGAFPAWVRGLVVLGGLGVAIMAMRVDTEED